MKQLFIIALLFSISVCSYSEPLDNNISLPVEIRGIWVNSDSLPKSIKAAKEMVHYYHKCGINLIFPEMICRGYAIFPSKLLERDPRFVNTPDFLPAMISEAHKYGMEVHPWVWVFRAGYTKDRGAILKKHPKWTELNEFGEDLSANGGLWLSPSIPEVCNFLSNLYSEMIIKYNPDGLHLDYVRYEVQSPSEYGFNEYSRNLYKNHYGIDPINIDRLSIEQYEWIKFRERQINNFVKRISDQIRQINPNIIISAAVGYDPVNSRLTLMQNWVNWSDNGWVDLLTPMTYTNNDQRFSDLIIKQRDAVNQNALLAPGIGLHTQKDKPGQVINQINISRENGLAGEALFAAPYLTENIYQLLENSAYTINANLPFRNSKQKAELLSKYADSFDNMTSDSKYDYIRNIAQALTQYSDFKISKKTYVPPSPLPLNLPEYIIPIPSINVIKTSSDIKIDGVLDDSAWQNAEQVNLSYTNTAASASVETKASILYDNSNLYIGYSCAEPLSSIKQLTTKRDGPTFYDDSVEVFIDPTGTHKTYYHLSTNLLGTKFDQKVLSPDWNGDWQTESKLISGYWTTEMAIPFKTLGMSTPAVGDICRINFTRNRQAAGIPEYINWSVTYGSFHTPRRFGITVFK